MITRVKIKPEGLEIECFGKLSKQSVILLITPNEAITLQRTIQNALFDWKNFIGKKISD